MMRVTFWRPMLGMLLVVLLPHEDIPRARVRARDAQVPVSKMDTAKQMSMPSHTRDDEAVSQPHDETRGGVRDRLVRWVPSRTAREDFPFLMAAVSQFFAVLANGNHGLLDVGITLFVDMG